LVDLDPDSQSRYATELSTLEPFQRDGLIELQGSRLTITESGSLFARNVAMAFDAYLRRETTPRAYSRTI